MAKIPFVKPKKNPMEATSLISPPPIEFSSKNIGTINGIGNIKRPNVDWMGLNLDIYIDSTFETWQNVTYF